MMCTTISPASTSTHSPVCSPSTPMLLAPPARRDLPARFGGGDDQCVVEAGQLADIENRDVPGLDVFEGGDGSLLELGGSNTTRGAMCWHDSGLRRAIPAALAAVYAPQGAPVSSCRDFP